MLLLFRWYYECTMLKETESCNSVIYAVKVRQRINPDCQTMLVLISLARQFKSENKVVQLHLDCVTFFHVKSKLEVAI